MNDGELKVVLAAQLRFLRQLTMMMALRPSTQAGTPSRQDLSAFKEIRLSRDTDEFERRSQCLAAVMSGVKIILHMSSLNHVSAAGCHHSPRAKTSPPF